MESPLLSDNFFCDTIFADTWYNTQMTVITYDNMVKLQFQVQGLGVDFVFPLSQQQEEQPNQIYQKTSLAGSATLDDTS